MKLKDEILKKIVKNLETNYKDWSFTELIVTNNKINISIWMGTGFHDIVSYPNLSVGLIWHYRIHKAIKKCKCSQLINNF